MMHLHKIHISAIIIISILSISTLSACTFSVPLEASSGSPVIEWTKTYGGPDDDVATSIVQTKDKGYVLAGSTKSFGQGSTDCWLIRTDLLGNVIWNRTYGGTNSDDVFSIFETSDGGYVIAGNTLSFDAGNSKIWLFKVNALGDIQWNKTYDGQASCAAQTNDGGYILVGNILLKTDALGNLEWSKPISGFSVAESNDEGYAVTYNVNKGFCLVKTDAFGNVESNKTYLVVEDPAAPTDAWGVSMIETRDEGYIVMGGRHGGAGSSTGFMYKIDSNGSKEWVNFYYGRIGKAVVQTVDGGYAVTGRAQYTSQRLFVIKTDEIGNVQWEIAAGYEGYSPPCSIIQTVDEGFALATSWPPFLLRGWEFYLCKISPYPRHNVAVSNVEVSPSPIQEGLVSVINVTVQNDGDYDEITEVFLYSDSSPIDSQNVTLLKGASKVVTFSWNTTGVKLGQHIMLANATHVIGETYTQDNIGQAIIMVMAGSKISISTVTSSVLVGLQISISGTLTDHREKAISGELVFLSYKVLGIETWNTITSVYTENNGHYSAIWIPTATGYFTLKAEWTGNATYFGISNITTLSVVPYNNKYVFAVESNSTISALAFNSTANELSFIASGPPGTMGYARVFISKELVANISDLKVYVDEGQVNYVTTSTDSSWILCFSYEHSTHDIVIAIPEFPSVLFLPLLLVSTLGAVVLSKKRRQKKRDLREKSPFDFLEHLA